MNQHGAGQQGPLPGPSQPDRPFGGQWGPGGQEPWVGQTPQGGQAPQGPPKYAGGYGQRPYGTPGGGQGYGLGGYGYPTGGYDTGSYGAAATQQYYGGRGFVDENLGSAGRWSAAWGWGQPGYAAYPGQPGTDYGGGGEGVGGSQYGQPGSYGARDQGGRQGWGAGGYGGQGTGLSVQGYGSTGYATGNPEANATWGMGGTQQARPEHRPEPNQRFGEAPEHRQQPRPPWRAPQGYQRPDQRIYEDVCDRLAQYPYVDPRSVTVRVENCVVTLEGTVATRQEKHLAEDVADAVPGVKDVQNHLRVGPSPHAQNKEEVIGLPEGSHMISRSDQRDQPDPEHKVEK